MRAFSYAGDSIARMARLTIVCMLEYVRLSLHMPRDHVAIIPLNISFLAPLNMHVLIFKSWLIKKFATANASGLGGRGCMGCWPPCC